MADAGRPAARPVSRWRVLWAWTGHRGDPAPALQMLLVPSDLPGEGWQQIRERTWRTARFRSDSDWLRRAGEIDSVTATRWFANHRMHCNLTLSAYPLASDEDAVAAVQEGPSLRSTSATAVDEQRIAGDVVVPSSPATWASEQRVVPYRGSPTATRFLRACAGPVLVSAVGSGCQHQPDIAPSWDVMIGIAEAAISRIARQGER